MSAKWTRASEIALAVDDGPYYRHHPHSVQPLPRRRGRALREVALVGFHAFLLICYISQSWALWYLLLYKIPDAKAEGFETTSTTSVEVTPPLPTSKNILEEIFSGKSLLYSEKPCYFTQIEPVRTHLTKILEFFTLASPIINTQIIYYNTSLVQIGADFFWNGDKDLFGTYERAVGMCANGHFGHMPVLTPELIKALQTTPNALRNNTKAFWLHTEYDPLSKSLLYPDNSRLIYYTTENKFATSLAVVPTSTECILFTVDTEVVTKQACDKEAAVICQRLRSDVLNHGRLERALSDIHFYQTFNPLSHLKNLLLQWRSDTCSTLPPKCSSAIPFDLTQSFGFDFKFWNPSEQTTKSPDGLQRLANTLEDAVNDLSAFRSLDQDEMWNPFILTMGWNGVELSLCQDHLFVYHPKTTSVKSDTIPLSTPSNESYDKSEINLINLIMELAQSFGIVFVLSLLLFLCMLKICCSRKRREVETPNAPSNERRKKSKLKRFCYFILRKLFCRKKSKKNLPDPKKTTTDNKLNSVPMHQMQQTGVDPLCATLIPPQSATVPAECTCQKKRTLSRIKSFLSINDSTPKLSHSTAQTDTSLLSPLDLAQPYPMNSTSDTFPSLLDPRYLSLTDATEKHVCTLTPFGTPVTFHRYYSKPPSFYSIRHVRGDAYDSDESLDMSE